LGYKLYKEIIMHMSFIAELSVSERPIMVLEHGAIGTRWDNGAPTRFRFSLIGGQCTIQVHGQDKWIGCGERGFLTLNAQPAYFNVFDAETGSGWSGASSGGVINLITATGDPVLQFGGDDGFDDEDALYNFLIAAQKVKIDIIGGGARYLVPSESNSWLEYSESKWYSPKPASIALNIKSIEVQS
jgi:hypothetical protein